MPKFTQIILPCRTHEGKLILDRKTLEQKVKGNPDADGLTLIIKDGRMRSPEQNRAFHGTVLDQVQQAHMDVDGEFISKDRLKEKLKEQFLPKVKRYYEDGSPVMVKIPHPEKPSVFFHWHFEEVPSTADLTVEQFTGFLNEIKAHYLHNYGAAIEILSDI
jgi:hypothetical protein